MTLQPLTSGTATHRRAHRTRATERKQRPHSGDQMLTSRPRSWPFSLRCGLLYCVIALRSQTAHEGVWRWDRRIRREQRQVDMAESRRTKRPCARPKADRRDARMIETVKQGKLPYAPVVMSCSAPSWQALGPDHGRGCAALADVVPCGAGGSPVAQTAGELPAPRNCRHGGAASRTTTARVARSRSNSGGTPAPVPRADASPSLFQGRAVAETAPDHGAVR